MITKKQEEDRKIMWNIFPKKLRSEPLSGAFCLISVIIDALNGWQLAKMKKSIPDMSLP